MVLILYFQQSLQQAAGAVRVMYQLLLQAVRAVVVITHTQQAVRLLHRGKGLLVVILQVVLQVDMQLAVGAVARQLLELRRQEPQLVMVELVEQLQFQVVPLLTQVAAAAEHIVLGVLTT